MIHHSPGSSSQNEGEYFIYSNASTPSRSDSKGGRHEDMDLNAAVNVLSDWTTEISRVLPTLNWTLLGKMLRLI